MRIHLRCAAAAAALVPSPALAWGKTGHRVVAAIADTQLSRPRPRPGRADPRARREPRRGRQLARRDALGAGRLLAEDRRRRGITWTSTASSMITRRLKATRSRRSTASAAILKDPKASLADKQTGAALRRPSGRRPSSAAPCRQARRRGRRQDRASPSSASRATSTWCGIRACPTMSNCRSPSSPRSLSGTFDHQQLIDWWDINPRDWVSESAEVREQIYADLPTRPRSRRARLKKGEKPPLPDRRLFLRLQVPAGDGAAAAAGGRSARGLSQRALRRTAAASRQMIRRLSAAFAALALAACAAQVAPPRRRRQRAPSKSRSSPSTISTAICKRPTRSRSPSRRHQAQDRRRAALRISRRRWRGCAPAIRTRSPSRPATRSAPRRSISANYLDEPTIDAMNLLGLELNSVGNHEFDRGADELKRMQAGGCAKFTRRVPCAVEPFGGARFRYLAANVVGADGSDHLSRDRDQAFRHARRADHHRLHRRDAERHRAYRHAVGRARADLQGRSGDRQRAGAAAQGARRRCDRPADPPGRQDRRSSPPATAATASTATSCRSCQARPGDHDGDLRAHPLGLCLPRDAAGRRRPAAHQRRQVWLFRHRPAARVRSRRPTGWSARTRAMSSSAMASAARTPPKRRWSTATRRRSRRSPAGSSAI